MQPLDPPRWPPLTGPMVDGAARADHAGARTGRSSRERHDTDFAYEIPGLARFRANVFCGPPRARRGVPRHPGEDPHGGAARPVAAHPEALPADQGAGARDRADRLRQVDDALRDGRLHQSDAPGPHHHDRRPDRVRAREPEVPDQPARGAARTPTRSRTPCARRCARIRTSCWSASCATSRRWRSPSRRPRPATSCSARCTRRPRRRPSTASSISSRPTVRRRSAMMLSESLRGVIAQTLCRKIGGGRVAALEVLIATQAISNLIREGKTFQIAVDHAGEQGGRHGDPERRADGPGDEEAGGAGRGAVEGGRQGGPRSAAEARRHQRRAAGRRRPPALPRQCAEGRARSPIGV